MTFSRAKGRFRTLFRRSFAEWPTTSESPTTACSACTRIIPLADAYTSKRDLDAGLENPKVLCATCFKGEREAQRAKEVSA